MTSASRQGSVNSVCAPAAREQRTTDSFDVGELIVAVAAGDRVAFRALYDRLSGRVMATAMRILRDRSLAEDAAQETFVKIWRHAGKFDPKRGSPLAWVGIIARNAALDQASSVRGVATETTADFDLGAYDAEPIDAQLIRCLQNLPEPRGEALVLMYVHGLTHQELAEKMSKPLGTIKSWLRRGALELRECLRE